MGIEVCWPAAPWLEGIGRKLGRWVKGSFFKHRRFVDDDDLLQQLAEWRTEVNTRRPCRATKVIPVVRLEEERPRLRPLRVAPTDLAVRVPIVVGPTGEVIHELHPYSTPADAIGIVVGLMAVACGVDYLAASRDAVVIRFGGVPVPVASPRTLVRTKDTPSPSDAADRQYLQALIDESGPRD